MRVIGLVAAIAAAVALAVNASIHFALAAPFDCNPGMLISQGGLFRIEAAANLVAAGLVVIRPRWWTGVVAGVVAVGGLGLLVFTVFAPLDLTAIGLPYIFEPSWYQAKVVAAVAQAIAAVGAVIVVFSIGRRTAAVREGT